MASRRTDADRTAAWFALASAAGALGLAFAITMAPGGGGLEAEVLAGIRRVADAPGATGRLLLGAMLAATFLGSFPVLAVVVLLCSALVWVRGAPGTAARMAVASFTGIAVANGVKLLIGRSRPEVVIHWAAVSSSSFPSGHSADGALVWLLLAGVAADRVRHPLGRLSLLVGAIALAASIGMSRLYLGVHWPTDVLGGWAFGGAWAAWAGPLIRRGPPPVRRVDR